MEKKGAAVGDGFRRRFFVIPASGRVMFYFLKDTSIRAQGYIHLGDGAVKGQDSSTFEVFDQVKQRNFVIRAKDSVQAECWLRCCKGFDKENLVYVLR
jgi:hypothetical protein